MKKKQAAFTLMEVLVALVILAISLTAVMRATTSDIQNNIHLEDKTIAIWIAQQAIYTLQLGLHGKVIAPQTLEQTTTAFERNWNWQAKLSTTPNQHVTQITVSVKKKPSNQTIIELTGYMRTPTNETTR